MSGSVDALVITALKEELAALLAVSSGRCGGWQRIDGDPPYHMATFEGDAGLIRVVAARLSRGGGIATAAVAERLAERLSPRCIAMCGVCTGHPDDTAPGDVVLADRVFQHDEGRQARDGFQADLWVHPTTDRWLRAAQELVGPAEGLPSYTEPTPEDGEWWFLEMLLADRDPQRSVAMRRYIPDDRRPTILRRLRDGKGYVLFTNGAFALTDGGRAAILEHLAFHGKEASKVPSHIHVGPIASGNRVIADDEIWTTVADRGMRKTLAVEMEAATIGQVAYGRMLPFVVAKGVVGHAERRQARSFRRVAAGASAEVLCHFLRRVLPVGGLVGSRAQETGPGPVEGDDGGADERRFPNVVVVPKADLELVRIPRGTLLMGSPDAEQGRDAYPEFWTRGGRHPESPQHQVSLAGFYMARTPVTHGKYRAFLEANPLVTEPPYWTDRGYAQDDQPVVGVSWNDAQAYCRWAGLRLPTEAQWEYACRAGTDTPYHSGKTPEDLARVGWYGDPGGQPRAVAQREPNQFGLYDMHGNVWEWCEDDWVLHYDGAVHRAGDGLRQEPKGDALRVVRGGSCWLVAADCRSATRGHGEPDLRNRLFGFRPVLAAREVSG
ncbi:MAG: SUMF1/EgtB/PvdO family nonheme iron enzyme [Deltaproteobacteria bacterium]|nr:SUMF1/EgtB/PvdO family nonheme iron enzyme [Deltaproteobacteria bacterium]